VTNIMNKLTFPIILALVALTAAGCGGAGRTSTTAGVATSVRARAVRFSACMRTHGIADFPDPNRDNDFDYGISVSATAWTRAVTACRAWQPPGTLSARRSQPAQSRALRFAACIRAHGVRDFPDPVNGEPIVDTYKIPSANRAGGMTILNAAMSACAALGPKR
jgi:hypothetical protein